MEVLRLAHSVARFPSRSASCLVLLLCCGLAAFLMPLLAASAFSARTCSCLMLLPCPAYLCLADTFSACHCFCFTGSLCQYEDAGMGTCRGLRSSLRSTIPSCGADPHGATVDSCNCA
eukprot:7955777-Alexandrium_andersonii.AAC.1